MSGVDIVLEEGDIAKVAGYDVWVNSENVALEMARMVEQTVSSTIRREGALWSGGAPGEGDLIRDTIALALKNAVGFHRPEIGDVIATTSGRLRPKGVKWIYHVISVNEQQKPASDVMKVCIPALLDRIEKDNRRLRRLYGYARSVLIPVFATGAASRPFALSFSEMIREIDAHLRDNGCFGLKKIGISCYESKDFELARAIISKNTEWNYIRATRVSSSR